MLEKIPTSIILFTLLCILLAGPAAVIGFWLGGSLVGGIIVVAFALLFVGIYIHTMRRYG